MSAPADNTDSSERKNAVPLAPPAAGVNSSVREFPELMATYDPSKNKTPPVLSKYERAKILGIRTEQISRGAKPLIDVGSAPSAFSSASSPSPSELALEELNQKRTPIIVVRNLPDGTREYWRIRDLVLVANA